MSGTTTQIGPFAANAPELHKREWHPIPVDTDDKKPSITGVTGNDGEDLTARQLGNMLCRYGRHNLGLRLSDDMIGLDIDQRDGKTGWDNLLAFQAERDLPDLPPTVFVTSREWPSGILLYRVAVGHRFNDSAIAGVDICQRHHRFIMGPGSVHPKTGQTYHATDLGTGEVLEVLPYADEVPDLPWAWQLALYAPPAESRPRAAVDWDNPNRDDPTPSEAVQAALRTHWTESKDRGRHPALIAAVTALWRLDSLHGHGTAGAMKQLRAQFVDAVTADGTRTADEASDEFDAASAWQLDYVRRTESDYSSDEDGAAGAGLNLPAEFWDARPVLAHIRQAAHSRLLSPDAVLAAVLARVAAATPPLWKLPAVVGGTSTVSTYVALVGPPGTGKALPSPPPETCSPSTAETR